jgi:hypothetical protein
MFSFITHSCKKHANFVRDPGPGVLYFGAVIFNRKIYFAIVDEEKAVYGQINLDCQQSLLLNNCGTGTRQNKCAISTH